MHPANQVKVFKEPVVALFLDTTQEKLFNEWKNPKTTESKREELYSQCQGVEAFRKFVSDTINRGQQAEKELEEMNK